MGLFKYFRGLVFFDSLNVKDQGRREAAAYLDRLVG